MNRKELEERFLLVAADAVANAIQDDDPIRAEENLRIALSAAEGLTTLRELQELDDRLGRILSAQWN